MTSNDNMSGNRLPEQFIADIFPEIKDPRQTATDVQDIFGPHRTWESGWESALKACRRHWRGKSGVRNWSKCVANWATNAIKYSQVKPIRKDDTYVPPTPTGPVTPEGTAAGIAKLKELASGIGKSVDRT